jgi:hypothetical protein
MTNSKKIISANGDLIKINYDLKTWSYKMYELDNIALKKVKRKFTILDIALLLFGSITVVIVSVFIHSLISLFLLALLFFIYNKSKIKYYIVISIGSNRVKIKIKNKDKTIVLGEIIQFLNFHFNYKMTGVVKESIVTF